MRSSSHTGISSSLAFLRDNQRWLGAGALLTFLSSFGQTFFISIFAGDIQRTFGLSHGDWGLLYAAGTMASAAVMIWAGGLTDRWRARALGTVVFVLLALSCLAMAVNTWVFLLPVIVFALRFTGQGMAHHIAMVAMGRWFKATRGRALAVAALGFSMGEALLPILFVALLTVLDWRLLWMGAAVVALAGIPVLRAFLQQERTPQSIATENVSTGMADRHWTRAQALRHPLFWLAVPTLAGLSAFGTAFFFHQVHYAEIKEWSHLALVGLFPLYTGVVIAAMLCSGIVLDRIGTPRLMPFILLPVAVAFVFFALAGSLWMGALGMVFFACTSGFYATTSNAFWAEFYGTAHLGSIKSVGMAVMVLGSAIGPGLTGALIDFGMSLETQYLWVSGYFLIAAALMGLGVVRARRDLATFA